MRGFGNPLADMAETGVNAADKPVNPANGFGPDKGIDRILDHQHRRSIDGRALKDTGIQLAALGKAQNFWHWP